MYLRNFGRVGVEYRNLSSYFREKYGKRLAKICIDGGFSCPNRDGSCGVGGCIYCGERGAGEHINGSGSITEQVRGALSGKRDDELFVAYFQNFTNTYAPVSVLKERYDAALIDSRIKVLAIGTRPDCISEEIAELIASYKNRVDVWVELGLQTANDKTATRINRGYGRAVFERAVKILEAYGIPIVVHLIVGLPGEDFKDIKETTAYISRFKLFGLKIHSLYVSRGTRLADMYEAGEFTPISREEYVRAAVYILSHVDPKTVIHRVTGDCPRGLLLAPEWSTDKNGIIAEIRQILEKM